MKEAKTNEKMLHLYTQKLIKLKKKKNEEIRRKMKNKKKIKKKVKNFSFLDK